MDGDAAEVQTGDAVEFGGFQQLKSVSLTGPLLNCHPSHEKQIPVFYCTMFAALIELISDTTQERSRLINRSIKGLFSNITDLYQYISVIIRF